VDRKGNPGETKNGLLSVVGIVMNWRNGEEKEGQCDERGKMTMSFIGYGLFAPSSAFVPPVLLSLFIIFCLCAFIFMFHPPRVGFPSRRSQLPLYPLSVHCSVFRSFPRFVSFFSCVLRPLSFSRSTSRQWPGPQFEH
jgi:hypothetical protein